ncbi:alginate lyase family protein [Streptomyces sp. NBC_01262]|uniref:alginate lyase family protein n=1 Tax=Streptomyces sp. NBC_01262 TaxID=2903803 RepID=UPI002E31CC4A|nr:alginate lyase family protein [Streptomyces sp. NBC_01262]
MMSRRSVLRITGAATVAAGLGTAAVAAASSATAAPAFAHPGMLHTQADFDRMAAKVKAGTGLWKQGYAKLAANPRGLSTWKANPLATVIRGADGDNVTTLAFDIHAAYQNALRWKVTGDTAHADAARDILNAWSAKLTTLDGSADRFIAAGIHGYQFANAAEIMRGYAGFDLARFKKMMLNIFYPMSSSFLAKHNGAYDTNYWSSWDLLSVACVLAVGILCDDQAKVDEAVTYFKTGKGLGSIKNAIPYLHPGGLGQRVEVGRDQGHALLSVGLLGTICEMAWNQGIDLYGYDDNRVLKGVEYAAKWNLGHDVPFTAWTWNYGAPGVWSGSQTLTKASESGRGGVRPIWESLYNHYVNRRGLDAPYVSAIAATVRPEGGGGDYGTGGGLDHLGFGTLAFTRAKAIVSATTPVPSVSTSETATSTDTGAATATATLTADASGGTQPQGGRGDDLAATGTGGITAVAATGVLAIAGGFIALRRRGTRGSS